MKKKNKYRGYENSKKKPQTGRPSLMLSGLKELQKPTKEQQEKNKEFRPKSGLKDHINCK